MTADNNKALVLRLVEAVNESDLNVLEDVAEGEIAAAARRWIGPFRESFPDFCMEVVELVAENDKVVAHLLCSGTHRRPWRGFPPTGRRFERVNEIYIFRVVNGKLAGAVGVEDNLGRLQQLGIARPTPRAVGDPPND